MSKTPLFFSLHHISNHSYVFNSWESYLKASWFSADFGVNPSSSWKTEHSHFGFGGFGSLRCGLYGIYLRFGYSVLSSAGQENSCCHKLFAFKLKKSFLKLESHA